MSMEILAVGDEAQAALEAEQATKTAEEEAADTEVTQTDSPEPEAETKEPEVEEAKFYFGGDEVTVEVPDDIAEALEKHGLDKDAVVSALFAKDSDFSLPEDMRAKLDEAYGKTMVDRVLNTFKADNDRVIAGYKQSQEEQRATLEKNAGEFNELVGGDEGFDKLNEWATANLDDNELAAINAAMQLPPEHWLAQKAVLQALHQRAGISSVEPEEKPLSLLTDLGGEGQSVAGGVPSKISKEEYQQKYMADPRYRKDPAYASQVDNARRAGQKAGI